MKKRDESRSSQFASVKKAKMNVNDTVNQSL